MKKLIFLFIGILVLAGCGQNLFAPKPENVPISSDPAEASALGEEALDNGDYSLAKKAFEQIINTSSDTEAVKDAKKNMFMTLTAENEVTPVDIVLKSGIIDAMSSMGDSSDSSGADTSATGKIADKLLDETLLTSMSSTFNKDGALNYIDNVTGIDKAETISVGDTISLDLKLTDGAAAKITVDTDGNLLVNGAKITAQTADSFGLTDPTAAANAGMTHMMNTFAVVIDKDKNGAIDSGEKNTLDSLKTAANTGDFDSGMQDTFEDTKVKENAMQELVMAKVQMELAVATMDTDGDSKADDPSTAGTYDMIKGMNDALSGIFSSFSDNGE